MTPVLLPQSSLLSISKVCSADACSAKCHASLTQPNVSLKQRQMLHLRSHDSVFCLKIFRRFQWFCEGPAELNLLVGLNYKAGVSFHSEYLQEDDI